MASSEHWQFDVNELRRVIVDHHIDLINDDSVMQFVPAGLKLELSIASPDGRVRAADELLKLHARNPDMRDALAGFVSDRVSGLTNRNAGLDLLGIDWDEPPDNPRFVGREDELRQINDSLLADKPLSVVISGFDGMGKSTLARKAIEDKNVQARYDTVWVSCSDIRNLSQIRRRIGSSLRKTSTAGFGLLSDVSSRRRDGLDDYDSSEGLGALQGQALWPRHGVRGQHKRLLVVLDGVDALAEATRGTMDLVHTFLRLQQRAVLITTAMRSIDVGCESTCLGLERLSYEDAVSLFERWWPPHREESPKDIQKRRSFVHRFEGYPLAITLAAQQVPKVGGLEVLRRVLEESGRDEDALDRTLRVVIEMASPTHPKLRRLLGSLAYWPSNICPLDAICACLDMSTHDEVLLVARPVIEQGLVFVSECNDGLYGSNNGLLLLRRQFCMLAPVAQRLRRLQPCTQAERDAVQDFCLRSIFDNSTQREAEELFPFLLELDPIFADALNDTRAERVQAALQAILRMPRRLWMQELDYRPFSPSAYSRFYPGFVVPKGSQVMELAADKATKLGRHDLSALIRLMSLEAALSLGFWQSDDTSVHQELDGVLEVFAGDSSPRVMRVHRKVHLLCAWIAISNDQKSSESHFSAFHQQSRQYLEAASTEANSASLPCNDDWFPFSTTESAHDVLEVLTIRHLLHCFAKDFSSARATLADMLGRIYCRTSFTEKSLLLCRATYAFVQRLTAEACVAGEVTFAAECLDAFAKDWEQKVVQCHAGVPAHRALFEVGWHPRLIAPILRVYLKRHPQRAFYLNELLSALRTETGPLDDCLTAYADSDDVHKLFVFIIAEMALIEPSAVRRRIRLNHAWLRLLATYKEIGGEGDPVPNFPPFRRMYCSYDIMPTIYCDSSEADFTNGRPAQSLLAEAKAVLPIPGTCQGVLDEIYTLCYRALDTILERDFSAAASAFRILETQIMYEDSAAHIDWEGWKPFPADVMRAAWPPIFRELAADCMVQYAESMGEREDDFPSFVGMPLGAKVSAPCSAGVSVSRPQAFAGLSRVNAFANIHAESSGAAKEALARRLQR